MIWFKNIYAYRLTREIDLDPEHLEQQLDAFRLTPCDKQEIQKMGWGNALGKHGTMLTHVCDGNILVRARKEEKMLPASVIKDSLNAKVEILEKEHGKSLKKKEKESIKEEIIFDLLPRAFSRFSENCALIMPKEQLILIDAGSIKKAEELLALLRKSLGSLPVAPIEIQIPVENAMTQWVKERQPPQYFTLGDEAELKALLEHGGTIRCKQQDLTSEEILNHINAEKFVTKLLLNWQERIEFMLCDDMSLKRLKFSEEVRAENEDIDNDDIMQRLDADLALMCGEFSALLPDLFASLSGLENAA